MYKYSPKTENILLDYEQTVYNLLTGYRATR